MKKRFLAGLTALIMAAATGCADDETSSESASLSEPAAASASEEKESSDDVKGLSMSVNGSDGKMTITRTGDRSTPMGDPDTWTIFVYLCGTDIESNFGSATTDVQQMLAF